MEIGVCINMNASLPDGIGLEKLDIYKNAGFDYVEVPLAQVMALDDNQFQNVVFTLKEKGIKCKACNNCFPTNIKLTGENYDEGLIKDYINKAFKRASALGVEIIVLGSPWSKNVPAGFPFETAWMQLVNTLKFIGDIAKEHNIVIAIEHLNRIESNIITSLSDGFKLSEDVDHPNIKCLVDYFHFRVGNEPLDAIKSGIAHAHIARPLGRRFPITEDEDEYINFFQALKNVGYNKAITIEAYSDNLETDAAKSIKLIKKLTKDSDTGSK